MVLNSKVVVGVAEVSAELCQHVACNPERLPGNQVLYLLFCFPFEQIHRFALCLCTVFCFPLPLPPPSSSSSTASPSGLAPSFHYSNSFYSSSSSSSSSDDDDSDDDDDVVIPDLPPRLL